MKPYKARKFEKRDSDRPEKREFTRPNRPKKEFDRNDSGSSGRKDSGFELHHAICDKCGIECDVPFKPTGNKPIYCRTCFRAGASESGGRSNSYDRERSNNFDRRPEPRDKFESKNTSSEDLDRINRKLDKIMKALKIE